MSWGGINMGKITYLPKQGPKEDIDIIQLSKDKIMINGVECQSMDLEEFIMGMDISPEAEERFIRGLFGVIRDELVGNWKAMKIFREVFKK